MKALKSRTILFVLGAIAVTFPTIAFACSRTLCTNQLGDGRMYTCYLSAEDADYCYYDCYSTY